MMNSLTLILIIHLLGNYYTLGDGAENNPQVSTTLGKINGYFKYSYNNKRFAAFQGIPYVKAPTGDLRFMNPEPISPWTGIWNATQLYNCLQVNPYEKNDGAIQQEDCLYLNVYVPQENPNPNANLDVIVHIHGGGFMIGSGNWYSYPDYLMDHNVILVTINYRLGVFGFLSTGDKTLPGNYGLKDQTMALKWIKEHISNFGGNPNSITISGFSAGGASVHYHTLSPLSKGLFDRAIAQSGCALNDWALNHDPRPRTMQIAASLDCTDSNDVIRCLQAQPANVLLEKSLTVAAKKYTRVGPFGPVVENGNTDAFLSHHPILLLKQGKIVNDVPVIFSTTADEGAFLAADLLRNGEDELNNNFEECAPYMLDYYYAVPKSNWASAATELKQYYMGEKNFSFLNLKPFSDMVSDRHFLNDIETAVKLHAKFTKSPIYYYAFYYSGPFDLFPVEGFKGVGHGNDVQFIYTNGRDKSEGLIESDKKLCDFFLKIYTSFTKNGIPKLDKVEWKPTNSENFTFLNISNGDDYKMQTVEHFAHGHIWRQLGFPY